MLDPNIPLSGSRSTVAYDPIGTLGGLMQAQALRQRTQAQQIDLDAARREQAAQDAFQRAVQRRSLAGQPIDYDGVADDLDQEGHGTVAVKLRQTVYELRKKAAEERAQGIDTNAKILTQVGQIANAMTPESYQRDRATITRIFGPEAAAELPAEYDENIIRQAQTRALSMSEKLTAERDAEAKANAARDDAREHAKNTPVNLKLWTDAVSGRLSLADSQEDLDRRFALLAEDGAPSTVLGQFDRKFSPGAVTRAAQFGITPDQRVSAANEAQRIGLETRRVGFEQQRVGLEGQRVGLERQRVERGGDDRLVQIMGPNGTPIWVAERDAIGKPAAQAARAVTGAERQALAYYNRAKEAADTVAPLEDAIGQMSLAGQARLQLAPNWLQSPENQSYRQAQRAFTEARLRKESGAAIPQHEIEADSKTYFAQPGDTAATIEQKRKARDTVLNGLAYGSGKAFDEYYGEPAPRPTIPAKAKANPFRK